jgi:hypothetical protein
MKRPRCQPRWGNRSGTVLLLGLLALLPGWGGRPVAAGQRPLAEWTILYYAAADSDLEWAILDDLRELVAAGSSAAVNVVALVDRHPSGDVDAGYSNAPVANLKAWRTAKLLYVKRGKLRELADWGEVNTGDPRTLTRFVSTVARAYPARRYGLIFTGHGFGWMGFGSDESHDDDVLSLDELAGALKVSGRATGGLELIGFDACTMAAFEVADAVAPYARVMVASEELMSQDGWNYTPLLEQLARAPYLRGFGLGRAIADTYQDHFARSENWSIRREERSLTLSLIALKKIPPLRRALDTLAAAGAMALREDRRSARKRIAAARHRAEEYGSAGWGDEPLEFYDLLDLARQLQRTMPEGPVAAAARSVADLMPAVIPYRIHGRRRPQASGLSIYFPADPELLLDETPPRYDRLPLARAGNWFPFLTLLTGGPAAAGDVAVTSSPTAR